MTELRRRWLLWCSLAVAFSPIIQNLAVNIRDDPGMRYILLPILLIGLLLRRDPRSHCETRPAAGPGLLIVGLVALVVGIAGGSWGIARIGLPVAMLGMTWVTGRPAVGVILLAFVCVPVPVFVEVMTSPRVESMWGEIGAGVLSRLGAELEVSGPLLRYHGERFELLPSDSGIVTAVVLGQVSWYLSLRAGRAFGQAVARAVCWGLLAAVIQPAVVLLCITSLPLGVPAVGRFGLSHGLWLLASFGVLSLHACARSGVSPGGGRNFETAS